MTNDNTPRSTSSKTFFDRCLFITDALSKWLVATEKDVLQAQESSNNTFQRLTASRKELIKPEITSLPENESGIELKTLTKTKPKIGKIVGGVITTLLMLVVGLVPECVKLEMYEYFRGIINHLFD